MSDNTDRSYGWDKAHGFNDYMERVIGISLIIISLTIIILLFIIVINDNMEKVIILFLATI